MDEDLIARRLEDALAQDPPRFGAFFLQRFFGLEITYGDGTCTVTIPTADYMGNPQGSLHGGIIALAADVSMGHLCHRELSTAVTLDMDVRFLRAITGTATCTARFLKAGRQLITVQSEVTDDKDRLCAVATATWFRRPAAEQGGEA